MVEKLMCPPLQELLSLAFGTATPEEMRACAEHLLVCPNCVGKLRELKAEDSVVRHIVERSKQTQDPEKKILESVVRRLKGVETTEAGLLGDSARKSADSTGLSLDRTIDLGPMRPSFSGEEIGWIANYRILQELGEGGMGKVFLAQDINLQRKVALKVMKTELSKDYNSRQRFLREARSMAALHHDRIVTVYQVGIEEETPYLAMELLQGRTLEEDLLTKTKLTAAEVIRIGKEIAEGLAAAHKAGMVHRDVKPANIWLTEDGGRVKLLDFGLARPAGGATDLSMSGMIIGTPRYMSPEQARGAEVDARSDLFSLGCVMYRMATGRPPFVGNDTMAIMSALALDNPDPVNISNPEMPPDLGKVIGRLLAKKPEERPASAKDVVLELDGVLPDSLAPTKPSPPRRATTPSKWTGVWVVTAAAAACLLIAAAGFGIWKLTHPVHEEEPGQDHRSNASGPSGTPIRIGILHSLSGTLGDSGRAVVDATTLAIEELNQKDGVLGRPLEIILADGKSDEEVFARRAEELIIKERVSVIFGCWTSAGRKKVRTVVEKHNHLLVYPVQYEGLEQSPCIVYNGAAPNQQIIPAVRYCFDKLKKSRYFLVGSDYIFPRTANEIIKQELRLRGGDVVGEEYLVLGSSDCTGVIAAIKKAKPDVILNTLNGDSNRPFFRALRQAGITPAQIPTFSFSVAEHELSSLNVDDMIGDYAAWNYFESIDRPENDAFKKRFRKRYGEYRRISDPLEAGYFGVMLWSQAANKAGSDLPENVRRAIRNQSYDAPGGPVRIDGETQHTWKIARIGKVALGGQFEIVYDSVDPIPPEPFPATRTRQEWESFLETLYRGWGGRWSNPGTDPR